MLYMKPVKQEHILGCGVSCVAFILRISYKEALQLFEDGENKANSCGFYCRDIIKAMEKTGVAYKLKYIKKDAGDMLFVRNTIILLRKSKKYEVGHYLVRYRNNWMDPWINVPELSVKAGYRIYLPGKPHYALIPVID